MLVLRASSSILVTLGIAAWSDVRFGGVRGPVPRPARAGVRWHGAKVVSGAVGRRVHPDLNKERRIAADPICRSALTIAASASIGYHPSAACKSGVRGSRNVLQMDFASVAHGCNQEFFHALRPNRRWQLALPMIASPSSSRRSPPCKARSSAIGMGGEGLRVAIIAYATSAQTSIQLGQMKTHTSIPRQLMAAIFVTALFVTVVFVPLAAQAAKLTPGSGRFEVAHAGKTIPVWYFLPEDARIDAPVLDRHARRQSRRRSLPRRMGSPRCANTGLFSWRRSSPRRRFPAMIATTWGTRWTTTGARYRENSGRSASWNRSSTRRRPRPATAASDTISTATPPERNSCIGSCISCPRREWPRPWPPMPAGGRCPIRRWIFLTACAAPAVDAGRAEDHVAASARRTVGNRGHRSRITSTCAVLPRRWRRGHTASRAGSSSTNPDGLGQASWACPLAGSLRPRRASTTTTRAWPRSRCGCLFGQPAITSRDPDRVRVLFGGDTSGGESYQEQYANQGGTNVLVEKGYKHGTAQLDRLLAAVDYRVINLETPLTARRDSPLKGKDYLHYSDPVKLPALFTRFGPVAFSLANNHTLDHGPEGLDDTRAALAAAGADWFGADANLADAAQPLLQEFRVGEQIRHARGVRRVRVSPGLRPGFPFLCPRRSPGRRTRRRARGASRPSRNCGAHARCLRGLFRALGRQLPVEKQRANRDCARALRDAGVDLVVGHGAHMLQEVEHDGRGWIFYSIGNFLFNARGRYAANQAPPFSLPLVVDFSMPERPPADRPAGVPDRERQPAHGLSAPVCDRSRIIDDRRAARRKEPLGRPRRAAVKRGVDECGPFLEFSTR